MLEAACPTAHVRARRGQRDLDAPLWKRVVEMGLLAADIGVLEQALIAEQMGRVLATVPWIATRAAQAALAEAGAKVPEDAPLALARDDDALVVDAHVAARCVVARGGDLCLAEGFDTTPAESIDFGRWLCRVRLRGASPRVGAREPALSRGFDVGAVLVAAEMCGAATRALEIATGYAKERTQFGRPIGSFQAVQHRLVDIWAPVEGLRSLVYAAAWALDRRDSSAPRRASMAKAYAGWRMPAAVSSTIQVHGGVGFTFEHDIHLYYRRVLVGAPLFGGAGEHRDRFLAATAT